MQRFLVDWLADWNWRELMRKRHQPTLNLLSARQVQTLGEGDHGDGGGLVFRVRDSAAHFIFRFTAPNGKRREMGLGAAPRNNAAQAGQCLAAARDAAAKARAQLQLGLDPIEERARTRRGAREEAAAAKEQKQREQLTLARAARQYHEREIEPSTSTKHGAQWLSSLENHMPEELWHAPIASITAPALLDFLIDLHNKVPETAMRVRQRLETIFEDAVFRGVCETNPAGATKRKLRKAKGRRRRGQFAALPFPEAPTFMAQLREVKGVAARCLEFAVLTAARTGEAISAEWNEFDLENGTWTVPGSKMKAGEPHVVYLSQRALDLLKEQQDLDKRYVFPSPRLDGGPLSNMAMLTLLTRMGARDRTTVHGLCRATFSTWANETGASRPDVIEACLAHQETNHVRKAYNRAQFAAERRALLAAWATFLDHVPKGAKIVPLPLKAA
jgi:integrase